MTPLMEIELSQKSAVRGNNISITVTDNSGDVREADFYVGVDGWKADYTKSEGNKHFFSYVVSGEENNGGVGVVNVAAYKIYRNSPINASNMREVALAVNHRNDLHLDITSHAENEIVSGTVIINASAWYDTAVEENSEGKPEVYVIRTVLESTENEMVEDADVLAPYSLKLDTSRYENGLHEFKITVYDTIDRKAEKIIRLNIQNGAAPAVAGQEEVRPDDLMGRPDGLRRQLRPGVDGVQDVRLRFRARGTGRIPPIIIGHPATSLF